MKLNDSCKKRRLNKIELDTPILIPSFSSLITKNISEVFTDLDDYLNDYSLVSAYDIKYNKINETHFNSSDIVFIDSGNYEYFTLRDKAADWSNEIYKGVLKGLPKMPHFVIVNYDFYESTKQQIEKAKILFSNFPRYTNCFLYKPEEDTILTINIPEYVKNINEMRHFDILGFTEKELGSSIEQRCKNIIKIREELYKKDYHHPIHIFGCLDPISIIAYFICGADIFDGLNWLKYGFFENNAIYMNNYAILSGNWTYLDGSVWKNMSINNLNELRHITSRMKIFERSKKWEVLELPEKTLKQIMALTSACGIDME